MKGAVLHVDTGLTWRGGQQQVFYLHQGLASAGQDSHLICSKGGELARRAGEAGLAVTPVPLRGEWDLPSAWRIAREVRRTRATLLHAHSSHAQTLALVASRLCGGCPVVSTRRVDFVPSGHVFNRWKYGSLNRLVVISDAIGKIMRRFGVAAERIRLVPSGVDLGKVAPGTGAGFRRELGIDSETPLVGNIAHLADHKGQRYLIEAIPRVLEHCPRARFVIVGEGELEVDLKRQAAALGLGDRLVFAGFRHDVPAIMDALDLFVMSSHLEGLGTIVMDALAAGKPVVATMAGGIPEIVEEGVHGLLVPVREPAALAAAMVRLLQDRALAARLAEQGRSRVAERFSVESMVAGNRAVYAELLGGRGARRCGSC